MLDHDRHLTDQELLEAVDHELSPQRQASADAHLAWCLVCQARRARLHRVVERFLASYQDDAGAGDGREVYPRERLRAALTETETGDRWQGSKRWLSSAAALLPQSLIVAAAVAAAVVLLLRVVHPSSPADPRSRLAAVERDALPVATLTPGATWNVSLTELCGAGAREERPIPPGVRQQVLHGYGMENVPSHEYELDQLITPELGGAPDPRNLWPQRYTSRVWNAHIKDQLEQLLPRLVCSQQVALETAQHDIARDWIAAYKKYFHADAPLRAHAAVVADDDVAFRAPEGVTYPVWRTVTAPRLEPNSAFLHWRWGPTPSAN